MSHVHRYVSASLLPFGSLRRYQKLVSQLQQNEPIPNIREQEDRASRIIKTTREKGWFATCLPDTDYPEALRQTSCPPLVLYSTRKLADLFSPLSIAVVGTRYPDSFGIEMTRRIVHELASSGCVVVSGMARGVDQTAHEQALRSGNATVSILGTGLDASYPRFSEELKARVSQSGALVTEFPPGTPPRKENFPRRNRIIAGICAGTVVVQAGDRSGSRITARWAMDEGRDVFACPSDPRSSLFPGTNKLIQEGAKLVSSGRDVMETYVDRLQFHSQAFETEGKNETTR
jgi:DNA processing protein